MEIEKIDSVHCRVSPDGRMKIKGLLSYDYIFWRKNQFGSTSKEEKGYFLTKDGYFLTGLLPRVEAFLKKKKINPKYIGRFKRLNSKPPEIKGVTFRDDQLPAIEVARKVQRGIIHHPTGSGKTLIIAGIISCFMPNKRVLFLCHTIEILMNAYKRFTEYGFEGLTLLGGDYKNRKEFLKGQICLSTIQSFSSFKPDEYVDRYDAVFVDEAHHISGMKTQYAKVLQTMLAPIRIGVTATIHEKKESRLAMEGLLGPVIAKLSMREAVEKKIIAQVKLNLVPVPAALQIMAMKGYKKTYRYGVIENRSRNRLIVEEITKSLANDETTLVMIKEIAHGELIYKMCKLFGLKRVVFIYGPSNLKSREKVLTQFQNKTIKCVIASVIWKEGVDIPSVDHVINAFGGKSEIPTVQVPGRGTRTDDGKKLEVKVTDFLDPYPYLAQHCIRRLVTYKKRGWL